MNIGVKKYISTIFNNSLEMKKFLAMIGAILFFARDFNTALFVRAFEMVGFNNEMAVLLKSFIPFILALPLLIENFNKVKPFFAVYLIVLSYFLISIIVNPINFDYYFIKFYGIDKVFLPSGGIFAIFFITLLYDKKDKSYLYYTFLITAILIGGLSLLQYIAASIRGYWTTTNYIGEEIKINYSLTFGFNVALMVNIFSAFYIFTKKKIFIIPIVLGYMGIIEAGNRMSLVLPLMFVFLYFMYTLINIIKNKSRKENINDMKRVSFLGGILILTFIIIFAFYALYYEKSGDINIGGENIETEESRNLNLLGSGNIFESNGRKEIQNASIRGIKTSPILGLGAYGDRPYVQKYHQAGYSHNFFLEVWSNFGIVLGIPLAVYLLNTLIFMLNQKKSFILVIYFSFLATSALHMTSLSFWIAIYLWTLIGTSIVLMDKENYWFYRLYKKIKK